MRKYTFLLAFTVILISSFVLTGRYFDSLTVEAEVAVVDPIRVDEDMISTGKVEFEKSKNIFPSSSCIVKEIFFKEGDCVKEGDVLMEVLKAQEKSLPANNTAKSTPDVSCSPELGALYKKYLESSQNSAEKDEKNLNPMGVVATNEVLKITSPVSGVLTSISSKEGQYISSSGIIATVSDRSTLQIRMKISETQISNVEVGQKVIITGVGFKDASYEGVVKSIAGQASGNQDGISSDVYVDVIVSVNTSDENLKPGFTAKCKVIFNKDLDVIVIPYKSVKADENGKEYVFKYEDGKTTKVYITTGRELDEGFEIKSGIEEGDYIITDPNCVSEGTCVKAKNIS